MDESHSRLVLEASLVRRFDANVPEVRNVRIFAVRVYRQMEASHSGFRSNVTFLEQLSAAVASCLWRELWKLILVSAAGCIRTFQIITAEIYEAAVDFDEHNSRANIGFYI